MMIPSPWRADFPAIAALQRQDQTYLDNAATTQKPQALLDALTHYYANGAANVHRAQHLPGAHRRRIRVTCVCVPAALCADNGVD